jgi:hypothetical protein
MSWICARQGAIIVTQQSNAQHWETSAATKLNAFGCYRTMALTEAFASLRTQRPRSPRLLQQVASLTQTLIHVSCKESTPVQNLHVWHLVQSVVRARCATTLLTFASLRTQQQQMVHVCRAQRRTNVSLLVPLIAHRSRTAFNWEPKVATTLRAVGSMVIANLHLFCNCCEVLAFSAFSGREQRGQASGMRVHLCVSAPELLDLGSCTWVHGHETF